MSALPRTPEFFPRMKVRGRRRHRQAPFQRMVGAINRMSLAVTAAAAAMVAMERALRDGPEVGS